MGNLYAPAFLRRPHFGSLFGHVCSNDGPIAYSEQLAANISMVDLPIGCVTLHLLLAKRARIHDYT